MKRIIFLALLLPMSLQSQTMTIEEYEPLSTLVVPGEIITHAKFPVIDVHSHHWQISKTYLDSVVTVMDSLNLAILVNLSGRGFSLLTRPEQRDLESENQALRTALELTHKHYPDRFITFTNISYIGIDDPGWLQNTLKQLEEDAKLGARGLKIYKDLGLTAKDSAGKRIPVDDERLDPIWAKCGELKIPVLIHSGEPAAFWLPKDKFNERWLELKEKPDRYRDPAIYPTWEQIMQEHLHVFEKHPETTFISGHMAWRANDLATLGEWLDRHPNMYTEIGAVLAELGRQPRFAREWFIKYQDRILFGKDITHKIEEYFVYFRVLESADEYFDYYRKRHAFWKMYGMHLPDDVLKKLYYKNALKIIPGIDASKYPE